MHPGSPTKLSVYELLRLYSNMKFFKAEDFDLKNYFKESYGSVDFLIARAKKGEVSCQIHLGTAYSRGIEGFVEKDTEKAIGWLDTAVQNGCTLSSVMQELGQLLVSQESHITSEKRTICITRQRVWEVHLRSLIWLKCIDVKLKEW